MVALVIGTCVIRRCQASNYTMLILGSIRQFCIFIHTFKAKKLLELCEHNSLKLKVPPVGFQERIQA